MNLDDLNNLDFENVGAWPIAVHIVASIIAGILVIGGIYYVDTQKQLTELKTKQREERDLKTRFEYKQQKAANLEKYKKQLKDLQKSFGSMLRKLPSKTEVPGLLEDISNQGVESGLDFVMFDPLNEISLDFYVELPVRMSLAGHYHNIGQFISRVAALDRIVTMHDFDLRFPPEKTNKKGQKKKKKDPGKLLLEVTAKTYRYADEEEIAMSRAKEEAKKKRGRRR